MNHKNMQGEWPKIVLNDLAANCHKIKNNTDVIRGLMKGETVLSLPIHMETLIESANSTELRFVLHCLLHLLYHGTRVRMELPLTNLLQIAK